MKIQHLRVMLDQNGDVVRSQHKKQGAFYHEPEYFSCAQWKLFSKVGYRLSQYGGKTIVEKDGVINEVTCNMCDNYNKRRGICQALGIEYTTKKKEVEHAEA